MKRKLRHTDPDKLETARQHAMPVHPTAVYSYIPKCACRTLRISVNIHNGDGDEVHFKPAVITDLISAAYAFTVIRDPFTRLASCFLDNIVGGIIRKLTFDPDVYTFRHFVADLPGMLNVNHHWMPQADLLLFVDYDDWFTLADFARAEIALAKRLGLRVTDAREKRFQDVAGAFADMPVRSIRRMKRSGLRPRHMALYDDDLRSDVASLYRQDVRLFKSIAGANA